MAVEVANDGDEEAGAQAVLPREPGAVVHHETVGGEAETHEVFLGRPHPLLPRSRWSPAMGPDGEEELFGGPVVAVLAESLHDLGQGRRLVAVQQELSVGGRNRSPPRFTGHPYPALDELSLEGVAEIERRLRRGETGDAFVAASEDASLEPDPARAPALGQDVGTPRVAQHHPVLDGVVAIPLVAHRRLLAVPGHARDLHPVPVVAEGALDGFPVTDPAPHERLIGFLDLQERVVQHDVAPDLGEPERRQRVRDEVHVMPLETGVPGADDVDGTFDDPVLGGRRIHQQSRRKAVARSQVMETGPRDRQLHPGGRHVTAVRVVAEERGPGLQVFHMDADGLAEAETPPDRVETPPEIGQRVFGEGRGPFSRKGRSPGGERRSARKDAQGPAPVQPPVRAGIPGTVTVHDAGSRFGWAPAPTSATAARNASSPRAPSTEVPCPTSPAPSSSGSTTVSGTEETE